MIQGLGRFLADRAGNFAIIGGLLSLPLIIAAGVAVDYARHVSSSRHLQELADITSLTLAASREQDEDKLGAMATDVIEANRDPGRLSSVEIASLVASADDIDIDLRGRVPATFTGILGYDYLPSAASALAERALRGHVEVALVLDNTWSMSDTDAKGKSKIDTLKAAAVQLVTELLKSDDGAVKIGLVPYADYVNVGTQNRNQPWLDVPADYTTTPAPRSCEWRNTRTVCDKEKPRTTCTRVVDGVSETYSCGGGCEPGYSRTVNVDPYEVCSGGGNGTTYSWFGCVGSRRSGDTRLHDNNAAVRYPGYLDTRIKCPTPIVTLTSGKQSLVNAINDMVINRGSYYRPFTYIPAGLIWGLNVLSPDQPFRDAGAYDGSNLRPRKVAVLMTDGENTLRFKSADGTHVKFNGNTTQQKQQFDQVNADTVAICDYMKSKSIEIFTVAFMVDDPTAKLILEGCASAPENYYDATDSDALMAAFSGISNSLRVVRLAR